MFSEELEFFIVNQEQLVSQFPGKTLVIKDKRVIGIYNNPLEAYVETLKVYELGTFMIQPCEEGPGAYTVTISTQEVFA